MADVDLVIAMLRRGGPRTYGVLLAQASANGWDRQRMEQAVIAAWGSGRVFFDTADRVVAL